VHVFITSRLPSGSAACFEEKEITAKSKTGKVEEAKKK
jgi:hypothetical protein